ncbi:MAG: hypothetical protein ACOYU3_00885 [Bacillota bacterium]
MEHSNDMTILHEIYQNARAGMDAVDMILPKTNDTGLIGDLSSQRTQYLDVAKKAAQQMLSSNEFPEDYNIFCKCALRTSIHFSTLLHTSPKHLAQLMINGSKKGVDEINLLLARHKQAEPQATELANEYITMEQNNMAKLNAYLS